MRAYQPWHVDVTREVRERWRTYMDDHFGLTLRNHLGQVTPGSLRQAEDDLVEAMFIGLRAEPVEQSLDLAHLRTVHERLFDQVYPWAGELRTVNMERPGGPRFAEWDEIEPRWTVLAEHVRAQGHLRGLDSSQFAHEAATVYNEVNTIHAFREGNGRSQRVWMSDLASAAGHSIDWKLADGRTNDLASGLAREGNIGPLREMMQTIVQARDAATASAMAGEVEISSTRTSPRTEPALPSQAAIVAQSMFASPPSKAASPGPVTYEKADRRRPDIPPRGLERD